MSIETNNAAGLFAVESKQTARVASRRIGFTLAAAMLAGTSLAPAAAQVFDVNGISVTTADFAALPGGLPIQILNNAVTTGTLRVNATGNLAFGGDLTNGTGVLALTKIGAGTLTLSGNNSFTGNTTVSVGTLQAGSLTALSAASRLNIAVGGTVDLNGFNSSVNGLNGTGTLTNSAGGAPAVLRLANSVSSSFGGTITGNVGLLMDSGAAIIQTLSQNSSFTGGVELRSGVLRLGANQALSGAAVSVTGNATLSALATGASIANSIEVAAGNSLGLTAASGGTLALGGVISGDGGINKLASGTVQLNAANSFAGATVLNGGRVEVGNAAAFSTGDVQVTGTTTLALTNPAASLTVANNFNTTGALTVAAPNAGSTFTLSGNINATADVTVNSGAGRVELTGANQFNNTNLRVRAGTLAVDGADALTGAASVRLATGAALEVTTASTIANTILAVGGAGAMVGDIVNNVDVTLSGRLHDASGADTLGLRKLGTGTLTLSNASVAATTRNQLGGDLDVQAGTVDVTGQLFADVSVAAGGNLDVTGGVTGNVAVAGTGEVGAAGTLVGNVTVNDTGQFVNTGALTGNVTVNALGGFGNTATGTTTGNVTVAAGGTFGGAGTITGNVSFANGVANSFRPFSGPGTVATLNVNGDLTLGDMTTSFFRFDAPGVSTAAPGVSDLVVVGGQLTLGGTLDISNLGGFGTGVYRLFTFGTINAGTPLNVVGTAPAGFTYSFTTAGNGFFLNVDPLAGGTFYWDGADSIGVAGVAGGSGTWNTTTTNWTNVDGLANTNWVNSAALSEAVFTGTGGTVTLGAGIQFNRLVFDVDGYTIEGNGNAMGIDAGSISVAGGATATINANIGGVNGLTKQEAGTLRLSGNNGYTGGTNIAAGRVEISSNTALGVDTVTIADGATLASIGSALTVANGFDVNGVSTIETGTNLTLSGNIAGTGGITKTGAAQLILAGNNSFAGDVNLDAGTIVARNGASLGNATNLNAAGGTTLAVGIPLAASVMTLGQSINIAGRGGLTIDLQGDALSFFVDELTGTPVFDGTELTLTGAISGGALNITGGGAVRLQGNNSQTSTFIDRSVVFAESANPFGTGSIRVNEGAIFANGAAALTLGQDIVVSGLFYVNGPQDVTLSGTISNLGEGATELGTLVKFGTNSLRLDGDNSINNVRLQDGVLIVGHNNALGAQTLDTANAAGTARTLRAGAADLVVQNQISLVGPLSVDTAGETLTLAGQIFNTGSLVKAGAGTLVLSGNNIYGGTTTINAGTVTAGSDTAFSTSVVTMANGTVLSNALGEDSQRTLANNFVLGNVSIDSAGNLFQLGGVLNGAGTVAKIGTGTLRVTGDSSNPVTGFTGTFDVQNGILDLNGRIAGNITVQTGGSLVGSGAANGTVTLNDTSVIAPGNSPGTLTFGSLVLANGTNLNFELAGVGATPGTDADLIVVTNDLTLDGVLNITGLAGFNVGVGERTLLTYGNLVANNGLTVSNAPPVDVTYDILAGPVGAAGSVRLNVAFTGTYRWDGTDLAPDGVVDGGAGTFNLTNTNFTNSDGTFNLAYGNNATDDIEFGGTAGTVAIASAINFDQMGFVTTGYVLNGAGSLNVNNSAINVNGNTATINTVIAGSNGLAKTGTGTLILNGNNSFTGGLAVDAGTVRIGSSTALGAGSVSFAAGTTLQGTTGAFPQIGNAIVLGGAVTFDANGAGTTINGAISGNGPLSIVDVGPAGTTSGFALGGANSFTGDVSVTNTLLIVTANNGLGNAANALTLNNAIFAQQGSFTTDRTITLTATERFLPLPGVTLTANGAIGGAGQLVKDGAGTLVLGNAANSYGGGTVITAGTVSIASDGALGAAGTSVSFSGTPLFGAAPTTLRFTADVTSGRAVAINNGFTAIIDTVTNDVRLDGAITGAGALTKIGAGDLTLTGTNSYAGGTNLNAGSLTVTNNDSIGTGALTTAAGTTLFAGLTAGGGSVIALANNVVLNGATTLNLQGTTADITPLGALTIDGTTLTLNGVISGAGSLLATGFGRVTLAGDNSYSGGTTLNFGAAYAGTDTAFGTGAITLDNGAIGNDSGALRTLANNIVLAAGSGGTILGPNDLTLTGVISGDGELVKRSTSTLTLNGANSHAGDTTLAGGTIVVGTSSALGTGTLFVESVGQSTTLTAGAADLALANEVFLQPSSTLVANTQAFTFTLDGAISGAGALTKIGSGNLVLNAANSYRGGSSINAGTVTVGNNSALGTSTVTMANGTILANNANSLNVGNAFSIGNVEVATGANTFTLSGPVNGAGLLTKTGSGNLILTGSNGYTGGTALTAGTITFNTNTALGTGTVTTTGGTTLAAGVNDPSGGQVLTLANAFSLGTGATTIDLQGSTLTFGNDSSIVADGTALTLNGVVSGAGSLVVGDFGTLTLNGNNSYAGGTVLNTRSTVYVGSDTALGTGQVTMNGGTFVYNIGGATRTLANSFLLNGGSWLGGTSDTVLTGPITGAGTLIKAGPATLVLNGDNSAYTGNSQLRDGRITVGTSTALGVGGALRVFAPGAAPLGASTTLTAGTTGLALANDVTLDVGSNLVVESGTGSFTLNGVILSAGALTKVQSGTLVLNGANSFTGGTALNAGTITLGNNTALGTGTLAMADGTTLQSGVDGLVVANAITTAGVGTVNPGALTLTLNGVISGAGSIAKNGSGLLILNGANSYAGGTAFNAGTIRVGNSLAFGTGAVTAAAGTTLQTGASGLTLANAIAMAGGMTVDNFANQMTLGGVLSGTGPLSVIDSTGGSSGVLTLAGDNSYTGGTVVTGTTLSVSQNANLGNVAGGLTLVGGTLRTTASFATARGIVLGAGGGTVAAATGTTLTSTGVISGTSLALNGGELVLNGTNTYTGGTALNAGTITVGTNAALGTAALAMANGTTLNVAPVTGTGVALANNVSLAGVGTINANATLTLTLNGIVSGAGSVTKTGAGVLALNGVNSYTGGTALNAGTISVGNNSALGTSTLTMADGTTLAAGVTGLTTANNIVTVGAATINSGATPSAYTVSGVISGAGSVIKQGTGVLTVSAANSYTGATTVAAGTLNVTGSLVSAVTVNSAAALTGTGTVGALSVLAGGSVNPGAVGTTNTATLTVTGAATLAGTYTVNVSPSANDRITAGGALTLGGTLAVVPTVPATFNQFNQLFTVASGASRTGTFATSTGLDQFGIAFAPVVEYTATAANIRLAPQSLVTLGNRFGGVTGNALEVAQAFDRAVAANTSVQAFFNVYANGGNDLPRTLRQISGEQRATERRVVLDSSRTIREAALDRLNGVVSMAGQQVSKTDGDTSLTFWLRGAGSWGKAQPGDAATAFTTEQRGILTGLDWKSNGLTLGGMFNYTSTNVEYQQLGGSSNVETVGGTLYAGYRKDGGLVVNAGGTVAGSRANGARAITLPSFQQSLAGTTTGTTYQMFGELAWDLAASADTRIEPFARLSYVKADFGALAETGGVAALTAAKQGNDVTITNLGMRFGANVASGKVALNASASWQGTTGDRDARTVIGIAALGQNSNIRSVLIDRSALSLQADAGVNLSDTIRFSLGYSGLIGKRNDDHGGRATLNFAF